MFGETENGVFLAKHISFTYSYELMLLIMHFLGLSCVYSEILFTIISFFQKLIKGDRNKSRGVENFSKSISGGGTIIQYSRIQSE